MKLLFIKTNKMSIIAWLLVGMIAGYLASIITNSNNSLVTDILIGMAGSLVGGLLVQLFTTNSFDLTTAFTSLNLTSIIVSILGAVIILAIAKAFRKNVAY